MRSFWDLFSWMKSRAPEAVVLLAPKSEFEFVDNAIVLLENAVRFVEQSAGNHTTTGEDGISDIVVAYLCRDGVIARRETNSNGHVDIFIESAFKKIYAICGEAKLFSSYSYHVTGLVQVLHYSTGRCGFGFLLEYVRDVPITDAIDKIRQGLLSDKPENMTTGPDDWPDIPFGLRTKHEHTSGRRVTILHLGVNMNVTPLAAKRRKAVAK